MRIEVLKRQVDEVDGEVWNIHGLPEVITTRYSFPSTISLYRRKCYDSLYKIMKELMLQPEITCPVMLFSGVPGIGKSLFSIFCMVNIMLDDATPLKEFFVEYRQGVYHKFTLVEKQVNSMEDADSPIKWVANFAINIEHHLLPNSKTDLILSDISDIVEPALTGRWTCIFASPNPARYKQRMNAQHRYTFIMPTWSEQELMYVDGNKDNWYERFVRFGGVPRYVLWDGNGDDPGAILQDAIEAKGSTVVGYFFQHGFGNIDHEKSYMLVHINPAWLPDDNDWDYNSRRVHSFASDDIFKSLAKKHEHDLLSMPVSLFNAGVASEVYGGGSAGNLFEKVVLWLKPIAKKTITIKSLVDGTEMDVTLPDSEILPRYWKAVGDRDGNLRHGVLYQPRIANLESGDCFCVIGREGGYVVVVLQMTVGRNHPIKVNGLRDIVLAYPMQTRNALVGKVLVFVTPVHGALDAQQPYHTQDGKVAQRFPIEVGGENGFVQYKCEYAI